MLYLLYYLADDHFMLEHCYIFPIRFDPQYFYFQSIKLMWKKLL